MDPAVLPVIEQELRALVDTGLPLVEVLTALRLALARTSSATC